MNKRTKITLDELMRRKEQMLEAKKQKKTCELYIESLDGTITVTTPDRATVNDCRSMPDGEGDAYLVYQCTTEPNLKSTELQKQFACETPVDIVEKVFAPGEIGNIAMEIINLAGYNSSSVQKVTENIKN